MDHFLFSNIRDWVPSQDVLCKRFREYGKLIKFCGRSNNASLFMAIAVYFGGARRGCIMIPTSSNRAGWSLIQKELRNFLSRGKSVTPAEVSSNNSGGVGQLVGGGQKGNNLPFYGKQRQFRDFENTGTMMGHNMIHGDPRVNVIHGNPGVNISVINGRPMRVFKFKLTTTNVALRIYKSESGRQVVKY